MKLIYYSLVPVSGAVLEDQWLQSVRSLRRYNREVPLHLVIYGALPSRIRSEATRSAVTLHQMSDYSDCLRALSEHGALLAKYPTFHKFLSLHQLPTKDVSQILFLDCDTFFVDDVAKIFKFYPSCDWYAREEPYSRCSHLGYDPAYVNQAALETLMQKEGLQQVFPFNSGVCVLNNRIWDRLDQLRESYLDFVWRLLVGRKLGMGASGPERQEIDSAFVKRLTPDDRLRALPYHSKNPWIIDQIALWMTLGCLRPPVTQGFLERTHVAQNGEIYTAFENGSQCIVVHYFGNPLSPLNVAHIIAPAK
jgi:hypothetical protein